MDWGAYYGAVYVTFFSSIHKVVAHVLTISTFFFTTYLDWSSLAASAYTVVHADRNYNNQRRVPQFLARGPFNTWGFDRGVNFQMENTADGRWELEIMSSWPTYLQLNVFGFDDYFYGDDDGDGIMDRLPPN